MGRVFRLTGMTGYMVIWAGQFFSALGAGMTTFALALWLWDHSRSATAFSLLSVVAFAPMVLLTPFVGALVDRWNQHLKLVLMIGDAGRLLTSALLLWLLASGQMALPWLLLLVFLEALVGAFQWPADSAATTVMLRREDYARAGGIQTTVGSLSTILAPVLGALLYSRIGLRGIVGLDMLGGVLALLSLLPVLVPNPPISAAGQASRSSLWREALYGFQFILANRNLLLLQLVFLFGNLLNGLTFTLQTPLILARSGQSAQALAAVQVAGGVAGILAGLGMAAWGGPKKRIHGVLLGWTISMTGVLIMGLGQSSLYWMVAVLIGAFGGPLTNSSNQAIWMTKTPPDVQGKVFSARRVIAMLAMPLSALMAGPLADKVLNPAMQGTSALSSVFGPLVGTGAGAGIAVMYLLASVTGIAVMLGMYAVKPVREVEALVPDFQAEEPQATAA